MSRSGTGIVTVPRSTMRLDWFMPSSPTVTGSSSLPSSSEVSANDAPGNRTTRYNVITSWFALPFTNSASMASSGISWPPLSRTIVSPCCRTKAHIVTTSLFPSHLDFEGEYCPRTPAGSVGKLTTSGAGSLSRSMWHSRPPS